MQQLPIPNTDLTISRLGFGCWGITSDFHWGDRDEQESTAAINAALDSGINFFDTAEAYGDGNSETLLGKVLADRRQQVVIATKAKPDSMHPDKIAAACERSLQRLGTDYIDLYQTHWTDPEIPIADTWSTMIKLKEQGKAREIGVCNLGVGQLADVCQLEQPACNQLPYNLIWRCIEHEILPRCRELNMPVLAYSPLMHGMLSGQYESASEVPDGRARSRHFDTNRKLARHGEPGCEEETFAAIRAIREIADEHGHVADVALAWVLAQPGITSVITGFRDTKQLAQNIATVEKPLADGVVVKLTEATETLNQTLGANPDMWQNAANSRYR